MMRATPILLALTFVVCLATSRTQAAEPALTLRLASGREFAGAIDSQTSDQALVLRSHSGSGMTIRRPIQWDRIIGATQGGQTLTVEELRLRAKEIAATAPKPEDRAQRTEDRGQPAEAAAPPEAQPAPPVYLPLVRTITFDVRIVNWDADVETDGLVVDLMPIDGDGYLTPVSGSVEVEFFAPQRRVFQHAPKSGGDTFERVERWTVAIDAADFTVNGVSLRLPFGAIHPEFDSDWFASPYGLVHVRLTSAGHGTFDASRDGVRVRPWAPNRDQLELHNYPRFLPTEAVGRHN